MESRSFTSLSLLVRMALECKQRVVAQHACAIVLNADQSAAGVLGIDTNFGRACVERVLQELFDNGSGPLDHLARRDFICDIIGEDSNAAHQE